MAHIVGLLNGITTSLMNLTGRVTSLETPKPAPPADPRRKPPPKAAAVFMPPLPTPLTKSAPLVPCPQVSSVFDLKAKVQRSPAKQLKVLLPTSLSETDEDPFKHYAPPP